MIRSFARFAIVMLAACLLGPIGARAAPVIEVLLSEPSSLHQSVADGLVRELGRRQGDWRVEISTVDGQSGREADLTVAIGTRALAAALSAPASRPVLSLLVPRLTYEGLAAGRRHASALYLDQSFTRQLKLLRLALPGVRKVAVPLGPVSREQQFALQQASEETGVMTSTATVNKGLDLLSTLSSLAEDSQVFLLLPDPMVMQRGTLQSLFLHTYRLRKPVMAYSAALVESGALIGLYTSPEQVGAEAARWIAASGAKGGFRLGPPRYPTQFSIRINRSVARSLDIRLPDEAELSRRLEAMP